jgi:small subunit ribosomal protein S20
MRQNARRRALNRSRRSALKSRLRSAREALARAAPGDAEKAAYDTGRLLDREASRGTVHPNAAARRKSRLARQLNALKAKPAAG